MSDTTADDQPVLGLLRRAAEVATANDRADLLANLNTAAARVQRPGTVLCVLGEFKQGKSSLVNALLDHDACPVDDDLATSVVTVVHHADEASAIVRRASDDPEAAPGTVVVEPVELAQIRELVTEAGNPENARRIERMDVGLPVDLLADGLTLVDTPGTGGLGAGHTAATLGFLPFADGLLFVTDASQELTRPELDLLLEASHRCPLVVCVLTKIDLHPHWRQIAELNRVHLDRHGANVLIVPVSSTLARAGHREESGIPVLLDVVREQVTDRAKSTAAARAAGAVERATEQLLQPLTAELAVLNDPTAAEALQLELTSARERLAHLRGPAAGWRAILGDRIGDLGNATAQDLRRTIRDMNRTIDDRLGELRSSEDWEQVSRALQAEVAAAVASLFEAVSVGALDVRAELAELLRVEDVHLAALEEAGHDLAVGDLWTDRDVVGSSTAVGDGIQALRGAQSGMIMFSMMGRVLPAAAATLVASNPILLGAGLLLGGKALRDQRERKLAQQRQEAKVAIRQFLDDVQFELGPKLQDAVRTVQRQLRDAAQDQIATQLQTATEAGKRAQSALEANKTQRVQRQAAVTAAREALQDIRAEAAVVLAAAGASVGGADA